jgi:hypothetical protein
MFEPWTNFGCQVGDAVSGLRHVFSTSVQNSIESVSSVSRSLNPKEMIGSDMRIQHRWSAGETSTGLPTKSAGGDKIEGWTAIGDVGGTVFLLPWPCHHFSKLADAPNIDQRQLEATNFHDDKFENSDDSWPAQEAESESGLPSNCGVNEQARQVYVRGQGHLSGRVQCLQVSAGDVFVVASCHGAIFQWRLITDTCRMAIDPHVRRLATLSLISTSPETTSSLSNKDPCGRAQTMSQTQIAAISAGRSIVSIRKDHNGSVGSGLEMGSGIYVGPPGWMKEITAEGLEADRRVALPDQGLQLEHAFGCDGRGAGCGAIVVTDHSQMEGRWLGDLVWFSGSVAIVHNAITGPVCDHM